MQRLHGCTWACMHACMEFFKQPTMHLIDTPLTRVLVLAGVGPGLGVGGNAIVPHQRRGTARQGQGRVVGVIRALKHFSSGGRVTNQAGHLQVHAWQSCTTLWLMAGMPPPGLRCQALQTLFKDSRQPPNPPHRFSTPPPPPPPTHTHHHHHRFCHPLGPACSCAASPIPLQVPPPLPPLLPFLLSGVSTSATAGRQQTRPTLVPFLLLLSAFHLSNTDAPH